MKYALLFRWSLLFVGLLIVNTGMAQVGQVLWEDNFDSFDENVWNKDIGDGCPDLCGWGNGELQHYLGDNVYIEEIADEPGNFALVLEAKRQSQGSKAFTSGKVTSKNKLAVKYGMIELRIRAPKDLSTGLWPAAWLLGTNEVSEGWPVCGEIDMMEMGHSSKFRNEQGFAHANENNLVGGNLIFYSDEACAPDNLSCAASIAYDHYYNQPYYNPASLTNRFMIYRMYWDEDEIRLTLEDNGIVHNLYTGPFPIGAESSEYQKPFYLLMNLAVGGNFTNATSNGNVNAELPGKMYIDYVRVKQWKGRGKVYTPEKIMANAGADKQLGVNESLTLDASGSYGAITEYTWSVDGEVISDQKTHELELYKGTHVIELEVGDSEGNYDCDAITISVNNAGIGDVIWQEDFASFNADIWNKDTGNGCDQGICGWGNQELQSYEEDNVYIEEMVDEPGNYALVIEAKKETSGISPFTSGKVTTENKLAIKYGVVEVRMKVPNVQNGLWPAAWLLGIDHRTVGWPNCGEIDMMEMGHAASTRQEEGYSGSSNNFVGANLLWYTGAACAADNLSCAASIAFDKNYSQPYISSRGLTNRYMTYRMYWDESQIRLTAVDNGTEHDLYTNPFPISRNESVFQKPYYFLLNLAVGGQFTGYLTENSVTAPMPSKMYIDYVKVSRWNGKGEVFVGGEDLLANAGGDSHTDDLDGDGFETVKLDGSGSYGAISSYEWSENGVVLSQEQKPELSLSAGVHNILLTVTDEDGKTATDFAKVDVRTLLWSDEFDVLDHDVWTAETGDGCPELCGWGNAELEYYQEENAYIEAMPGDATNNVLVIEAKREAVGGKSFTSARLKTQDNITVKYGLVEVRMKTPDDLSTGLWPAAWLLGNNIDEVGWPKSGEIDMMEMGHKNQARVDEGFEGYTENDMVGGNIIFYSDEACSGSPDCAASIAYDKYYSKPYVGNSSISRRFLTYRMYWSPNEIRLTAEDNGIEFDLYTGPFPLGPDADEFHRPFFLLLNLAVGGNFTDAPNASSVTADMPAKMLVDYVRVFRWNDYGEVATKDGLIAYAGTDIVSLDQNSDGKEIVILDASGSAHHNGNIVDYAWSLDGEEIATGKTASIELVRGDYEVVLTITDDSGKEATDLLAIKVSNGGLAPVADAGQDQTVEDDNDDDLALVTLDASASEASNAPIASYRWLLDEVEIATGVSPTVSLTTGVHEVVLEVTDEDEAVGTDVVLITVIDPDNAAPIAVSGGNRSINDDDGDDEVTFTLDASGSSDSDGTIEQYEWWLDDEILGTSASEEITLTTGVYEISLVITDDDGVEGKDDFVVTIIDPDNNPPTAKAGEDVLIIDEDLDGMEPYTLDASESTDSDGEITSYSWSDGTSILGEDATLKLELAVGEHNITLTTTDDDGEFSRDEIKVIVNQLPVANAGDDIVVIATDGDNAASVNLDASLSSDANGSIIAYEWIYNDELISIAREINRSFSIGAHVVTLKVEDNHGSWDSDELNVFVATPDNQAPTAHAGEDQTLREDDGDGILSVQMDASSSSDSDGSIFSYVWSKNGEEIGNGQNPTLDFAIGSHRVTLKITDNEGATAEDEVMIEVKKRDNIALNKTVTSSSEETPTTQGNNAVDDDMESRWASAFSDNEWIAVDLGDFYQVDQISLVWEDAYGKSYEIQISNDGSTWTKLMAENDGDGENDDLNVSGKGRYVRMLGKLRGTEYGYSLYEFQIFGTLIGPVADATLSDLKIDGKTVSGFSTDKFSYQTVANDNASIPIVTAKTSHSKASLQISQVTSSTGEARVVVLSEDKSVTLTYTINFVSVAKSNNLALNKPTTTSTNESNEVFGENAVDGNYSSRWSSAFADPQWIYVDLGTSYFINQVLLTWEGAFATAYQIQTSEDASDWTTIYSESNGNGEKDEIDVEGKGRYVRIHGTSRGTPYGYSLYELEVYGSTTDKVLSTEIEEQLHFKLFPNPTDGLVNIEIQKTEGTIQIIDVSGQVLRNIRADNPSMSVSLHDLPSGLYFVRYEVEGNVAVKKLMRLP